VPTILLARHAQASFGAPDYDVLSPDGNEQAHALADDIERRGVRVDRVVTGSLTRQRDTAAPVAVAASVVAAVDPRWDEYLTDDILAHHSAAGARLESSPGAEALPLSSRDFQDVLERALLAWIAAGAEGPTAEPWLAFAARVDAALADVVRVLGRGETALVCTSGGVLGAICVRLLGLPAPALVAFNRVSVNAGVTRVVHGRGGTTLVSFNEHAHLERPGGSLVTYR
jgi:broad specificity phosphatase PhoE